MNEVGTNENRKGRLTLYEVDFSRLHVGYRIDPRPHNIRPEQRFLINETSRWSQNLKRGFKRIRYGELEGCRLKIGLS